MNLWERVKAHLNQQATLAKDKMSQPADIEVRTATAILLLEAAYGDQEYAWSEHHVILTGLQRSFGIGRTDALELLGRAEEIRPPAVKLDDVTDILRKRYGETQRQDVVTLLWQVIDADDVVEEWEEAFAVHVSRAVGLSPIQAAAARARASE